MKKLVLSDLHKDIGGKMVEFAGYYMPVQYEGVKAEHNTVRNAVGVFDVSHMGEVFVSGKNALDFLQYVTRDEVINQIASPGSVDFQKLIDLIPSVAIPNYAFENRGDLDFINKAEVLGLSKPSFSNGSAYGDLDNDGDYDLIVNNVMKTCVELKYMEVG